MAVGLLLSLVFCVSIFLPLMGITSLVNPKFPYFTPRKLS